MKYFINSVALTSLFFSAIFFKQAQSLHLRHLQTHQVNGSNVVSLCALNNKVISVQQGNPFFISWQISEQGEMYRSYPARRETIKVNDCLPILGLCAHGNMLISWTISHINTWRVLGVLKDEPIIPLCVQDLSKSEEVESIMSISNNRLIVTKKSKSIQRKLRNEFWKITEDGTIKHLSTIKNSKHAAMCTYGNLLFYEESQGLIKGALIEAIRMSFTDLALSQEAHNDFITTLHANNGLLFSASIDGSIKIWQISQNGELTLLHTQESAHTQAIYALCTYNDLLLSSGADGTIKTWRIEATEQAI